MIQEVNDATTGEPGGCREVVKSAEGQENEENESLGGSSSVINKGLNQGDCREEGIESKEKYSLKFHKPKEIIVE